MGRASMDPHTHRTFSVLPVLTRVCSLPDPDETGDDHPGPGRTLGKGYDMVGRPMERLLNNIAEKMGKGPRMTAERIRRRRNKVISMTALDLGNFCPCRKCGVEDAYCPEYARSISRSARRLKKLSKKIDADCKRLVGYLNSEVPSTQRQALQYVLDFSVCDWDIRALLKSHGALEAISNLSETYSSFRIGDADDLCDLLLSSSRKALVSLGDAKINSLLGEFAYLIKDLWRNKAESRDLWKQISPYLHDPDVAFLVIRFLRREQSNTHFLRGDIIRSIKDSPAYFEWDECEVFISENSYYFITDGEESFIWDWVLRHVQNMPRVLNERVMPRLSGCSTLKDIYNFSDWHMTIYSILKGILSETGADEQTLSLEALKGIYTHPSLSHLLSLLVCPLDRAVSNFVEFKFLFYLYVPSLSESRLYDELVRYIYSIEPVLRMKAWEYILYFLALDVYRCEMMLEALSRTPFGATKDFQRFSELNRMVCSPEAARCDYGDKFFRHFDGDGNVHYDPAMCLCSEPKEEKNRCPSEWILWLRVERGVSFSKARHVPLVTGYDIDGVPTYLARIDGAWIYAISDGMKPEDLCIEAQWSHSRWLFVPDKFEVPVLRYAPEAYARYLGTDEESLFTTGPFSWKPAEPDEVNRYGSRVRVLTVQEATAASFSVEDSQDGGKTREEAEHVERNDEDRRDEGGPDAAGSLSDEGDQSGIHEESTGSPQSIAEPSSCECTMCRRSRLPNQPERMALEMNGLNHYSEANEREMMDDGMGHEFGEEINPGSDAHPHDMCSSFHEESIGRASATDAELFIESTGSFGRTGDATALQPDELVTGWSDATSEISQTFESCCEGNDLSEVETRARLDDLQLSSQEPSERKMTTTLELPTDIDACNGITKGAAAPELGDDDSAGPQTAQALENRRDGRSRTVALHAFTLVAGIALGKYIL